MIKYGLLIALILCKLNVVANADTSATPKKYYLFNKQIDEAQAKADLLDRKKDSIVGLTKNAEINLQITDAIYRKVDGMQVTIENNNKLKTPNEQIRYLVYLKNLVLNFNYAISTKQFNALYTPTLVKSFEKAMQLDVDSLSIIPVINDNNYEVSKILADVFNSTNDYAEIRKLLYLKYCTANPTKILETLEPYAKEPFADSLIILAANRNPGQLYNYASAKNKLTGKAIHASNNPLVKNIAALSQLPNALFYFPFLDEIISGKKTIETISKYVGDGETTYDSIGYFKLLVRTEIDYAKRLHAKDTPIAMFGANGLREALRRKDSTHFIQWINALHDKPENVRMKSIDSLSSVDLYYAIVMGEDDIYTSSYVHSFKRMLQRLGKNPKTDSLLQIVDYDYFKKFIKMAAGFSKLDTFLKLMPADKAEGLMKNFVAGLENTGNLEDAVDVADSYSSIKDKKLLANMLSYVKLNEIKAEAKDDERGKTIYSLLKTIFLSTDTTLKPKVDLTSSFGIPSIYEIGLPQLKDDSNNIAEQMFFYGDDDGKTGYNGFYNSFDRKIWKVIDKPEWIEITPIKNPYRFTIYANKALNSDKNLDDSAQVHLNEYLRVKQIAPTITVHRGHSYWLPGTIKRMADDCKVVILGSCGGYKNLATIIKTSPNAHIISAKQIGRGNINGALLRYFHDQIVTGKTINWPVMWASLNKVFNADKNADNRESWQDYVPPYKNLGAIFLKAYNKKMQEL